MPKISVIVPVYNTEQYLHRCIDSILAQTYWDFELLLVDDGSTDASGVICDEYAEKDSRIKVFHQVNQGQAAARNHALDWVFANSDSEYISFVDSDDWVHPRFLELLYEANQRCGTNISQCGYRETDGTETAPEVFDTAFCITPEEQFVHHYSASVWDKLFLKDCWCEKRFPEGQIYEDLAVCYRILFSEQKLAFVDGVLYYYYINPTSTVHKDWTVAHFARIRAWDAIIEYLTARGNNPVLVNAVYRYCHIAKRQYDEIGKSRKESALTRWKYKTRVKYRVIKRLIKNKNEMISNDIYSYFFSWAFPVMGWLYWTCKGISGKVKNNRKS